MNKPVVGVDVSKQWLDAAIAEVPHGERIANTAAAIGAWLDRLDPAVVAFEPTGGYERVLQAALRSISNAAAS